MKPSNFACVAAALCMHSAAIAGFSLHTTDVFDKAPTGMEEVDKDGKNKWQNPPWTGTYKATGDDTAVSGSTSFVGTLTPGMSMGLGLDNVENLTKVKTFTIKIFIQGKDAKPELQTPAYGYKNPLTKSKVERKGEPEFKNGWLTATWTINPQPAWEYIIIKNAGTDLFKMSDLTLSSTCAAVPAPGAMILATAGFMLTIRRR